MSEGLSGRSATLSVDGSLLAETRVFIISMDDEEIDFTNKDSNFWREFKTGIRNWGISGSGLYIYNDLAKKKIQDHYESRSPATLNVILTLPCGIYTMQGEAVLTSLNYPAPHDKSATITFILEGTDVLTTEEFKLVKVSVYLSSNQENIPTDTDTLVQLDTENFDTDNDFDTTNHKFVTPEVGYYLLVGQIRWKDPIQNKHTYGYLSKNGTAITDAVVVNVMYYGGAWPSAHTQNMIKIVYLNENDEIYLCCRHNGGVNTPDILAGNERTFLTISRLAEIN